MDLYRLVYCSNFALKSTGTALAADLKGVLSSSIEHNQMDGISGGLVFSRNHFVQVLEGTRAAVENTFGRIKLDPRHTGVTQIEAKPINDRMFGAWSMGYAGNAALFDKVRKGVTAAGVIDPSLIDAEDLVLSVHQLVQSEMHKASTQPLAPSPSAA